METLFLICVLKNKGSNKVLYSCGPYLSLDDALIIMSDHLPLILKAENIDKSHYIVELREVLPGDNNWILIDTKITANENFYLESIDESIIR